MNTRWTGLLSFRTAVLLILMLLPASAWAAAGEAGVPSFEGPLDVARAYRLYDAGRLEEAEAAFLALTAEDPTNLDAQEGLTWTYLTRGKHEEAARSADSRLALAPDDEQWRQRWIEIIHQLPARREEAIAAAEALLKKRPDDLGAKRLRGRLLSWTPGREDEARELFDALIAENGRDAEALYGRSEIARWAGDYETANRLLRRAAEADPDNKRIRAA
ncbi:MAG: tetratricopeptide repeat protein, partial [Deltaproteobacteria bacterium]|nr:tetratricopeptide repeat protein [Deltaproteobacteria bacterium]